jgi:hypothetical protein
MNELANGWDAKRCVRDQIFYGVLLSSIRFFFVVLYHVWSLLVRRQRYACECYVDWI